MLPYIARRTLQIVPILIVIICFNFFLIHLAPGDPIVHLIGDAQASEDFIRQLRAQYGLDRPIYEQLFIYLFHMLQGDLGYSLVSRERVSTIMLSRLPATLLLLGTQYVLAIAIGIVLGAFSAARQGSLADRGVTVLSLIGFAVPAFWLAQMMVLVFGLKLDLFPAAGMRNVRADPSGIAGMLDVLHHLVLPVITLTVFNLALIARVTRASMANALRMEYITFARSKGVAEGAVVWSHALRNAVLPVVTVIGLHSRTLIAGAVLTETVFAWPGIGRLTYEAIVARDYPVLMGIFTVIGVTVVVTNILTDIAYARLDPRVRYQ